MLNGWTRECNFTSGRGSQRSPDMELKVFWGLWSVSSFKILLQGKKWPSWEPSPKSMLSVGMWVEQLDQGALLQWIIEKSLAASGPRGTTAVWQLPLVHKLPTMYKRAQLGADVGMRVIQLKNWLQVKLNIGLYKVDHTCSLTVIHLSLHCSRSRLPAAFYRGKELATVSHYVFLSFKARFSARPHPT